MAILQGVTTGVKQTGQRIVIAALEKVGKTTLACNAPRALLVPLEIGYAAMTVPKTPMLTDFWQCMNLIDEIRAECIAGRFQAKSIVWDSASALERLIHDAVLQSDPKYAKRNAKALTMEEALGGYGKAYSYANELFGKFLSANDELAQFGGLNIIITCHVFAAKQIDPAYGEFDQWDLLLHSPKNNKSYGKREMITQWADMIGFLHEPFYVSKGEGESLARGTSKNIGRVLAVDRTPGYVAGNRYGLTGEISIPPVNGWNALAQRIFDSKGIDLFNRDV